MRYLILSFMKTANRYWSAVEVEKAAAYLVSNTESWEMPAAKSTQVERQVYRNGRPAPMKADCRSKSADRARLNRGQSLENA